jgi:hypothetical protein
MPAQKAPLGRKIAGRAFSSASRPQSLRKKSRCWSKLPLNTIIDGSPDSASTVGSPISTSTSGENESNISPSVCSSKPNMDAELAAIHSVIR